ncbi:MAG: NADH-quinone oxidoreductase subunit L, partial [Candidatus Micrarchaeaceae archaeon]
MIPVIVILPVVAVAFLALLLGSRKATGYIALAGMLVSFMLSLLMLYNKPTYTSLLWFEIGSTAVHLSFATAQINMLLLLIVTGIGSLICLYSIGYIESPSQRGRFFFELLVFAAAMMLFAISGNFVTMFIGWELLGVTSYLLIGFWYWKPNVPRAARKSITTIIIGDIAILMAMVIIWTTYHTFSFEAILSAQYTKDMSIALLLVLVGVFTKSAQFPFHEWLADAMEGPTPVSAFLHSSTMVKAGVFLVAVLLPLFIKAGLQPLLIAIGTITVILGASNALAEHHIKRILAYSTIEDLGLMIIALGFGALAAAMLLFLVQALYKGTIFMGAGSIMRANEEETDIYYNYGSSTRKALFIPNVIAAASLAGIFPFSGFFGKFAVESSVNAIIYPILLAIDVASSAYIFRWLFIPMQKPERQSLSKARYSSIPYSMLSSEIILAAAILAAGYAFIYLPKYLGYNLLLGGILGAIAESIAVGIGFAASYYVYRKHIDRVPYTIL